MSGIQKTLSFFYSILMTGTRLRRELYTDVAATPVSVDMDYKEISVGASQQITLTGIAAVFFLKPDAPIQIKVNNSDYFAATDAVIINAPLNEVIIFNPGTTAVNCVLIDA
jgi:hypothetical protein